MIDIPTTIAIIAVAVSAFLAGWRAHRWHVLSFCHWPSRPLIKASTRRTRAFSFQRAHRR